MSLGYSLSCSKEALICFPRGSPEIPGQIEVGMEKLDPAISMKQSRHT